VRRNIKCLGKLCAADTVTVQHIRRAAHALSAMRPCACQHLLTKHGTSAAGAPARPCAAGRRPRASGSAPAGRPARSAAGRPPRPAAPHRTQFPQLPLSCMRSYPAPICRAPTSAACATAALVDTQYPALICRTSSSATFAAVHGVTVLKIACAAHVAGQTSMRKRLPDPKPNHDQGTTW